MPPKNAEKRTQGKKPLPIIVDGVDTSNFTRERLEKFARLKKVELNRQREERNICQIERDKVKTFWDIAQNQLEEIRAEIRNKERSIEEARERNEALLETENQKIKFLKYEEESTAAALRAEDQVSREAALQEHIEQENMLFNNKRDLNTEMSENEQEAKEELRKLKIVQADELKKVKVDFRQREKEMEMNLENNLTKTVEKLIVKHRTELNEIEERKNKQLAELIDNNESSFADLKNYYNDITVNNLGLINSLKEQINEMQAQKSDSDLVAANAKSYTRILQGPLQKALLENEELTRQFGNYQRNKVALASKNRSIKTVGKDYEDLKQEYEMLQENFDQVEGERNKLRSNFTNSLLILKKQVAHRTSYLGIRFENLKDRDIVPTQLQDLLRMRNLQLHELRYEASRLHKAHDDLLATYEVKLARLGVSPQDLGLEPVKPVPIEGMKSPIIGLGPAGLVAKNNL